MPHGAIFTFAGTILCIAAANAVSVANDTLPISRAEAQFKEDKLQALVNSMGVADAVTGFVQLQEYASEFDFCTITSTTSCDLDYLRTHQSPGKHGWIVYPGGDTICLDGSPYAFQVYPGHDDNTNTLFFFQDGGACYDYETCVKLGLSYDNVRVDTGGLMAYGNAENPVAKNGWTTIHLQYCSGDAYMGNQQARVVSDLPFSNKSATIHQNGVNNTLAVLSWFDRQPESKPTHQLSLAGCSAGSLGLQFWSRYMIDCFNATVPKMLLDSYIGDFPVSAGQDLAMMGICETGRDLMNWPANLVQQCLKGDVHEMKPVFELFLKAKNDTRVAYTGSIHDMVQSGFYAMTYTNDKTDMSVFLKAFAEVGKQFPEYLESTLREYEAMDVNFSHFLVNSNHHCFLNYNDLYQSNITTAIDTNVTMLQYLDTFFNSDLVKDESYPQYNVTV